MLRYEPYIDIDDETPNQYFIHMGQTKFYHMNHDYEQEGAEMEINEEHYNPSFIARDVDELRENKNTLKLLRKFRIINKVEEAKTNWEEIGRRSSQGSVTALTEEKKPRLSTDEKMLKSEDKEKEIEM